MKGVSVYSLIGLIVGSILVLMTAGVIDGFTESTAEGEGLVSGSNAASDLASELDSFCQSSRNQGNTYVDLDEDSGNRIVIQNEPPTVKLINDGETEDETELGNCDSVNEYEIRIEREVGFEKDGDNGVRVN